ncbi:TRAP transporter small permease [Paracoccus siganidrum]|uniref:TRAP transporter small permease protein n=1 Tax=Paracoccus siganidrum TaxID=1276757 RepID=A0A418ZZI7_9RHOB|nr:TRAP transporter small permease [Paracoccus siganidrum]RJL05917.1 TRAP transporter small permease [Paracoccus siganidrum]RMC33013.1 TRAP transporter small permease [Paracoccus siganidrum]
MSEIDALPEPAPAPRLLEMAATCLLAIATGLMLLIVALIVAQIAARNFWNMGLPRAEELSRLAGVLCVYLTAPVLALRGHHVAVDVFVNLLPALPRRLCLILAELSIIAFAGLSIWGGYLYLLRAWRFRTPALGVQNIWLYGPVLICLALLVVMAAWRIRSLLRSERGAA